jgi:hypothetical protein
MALASIEVKLSTSTMRSLLVLVGIATFAPRALPAAPAELLQEAAVKRVVTKWLTHTRKREWSSMVGIAPRDWVTHNGPPAAAAATIADYYHNVQLSSWTIRETRQSNDTEFLVVVDVESSSGPRNLMVKVIRERGKWLIDPETAVIR